MRRMLKLAAALAAALAVILLLLLLYVFSISEEIRDLGQPAAGPIQVLGTGHREEIQAAEARLTEMRRELRAPAVSLSVGLGTRLIWSEARGYSDLESQAEVTLGSRFPIGSVSKPLTATAALALAEEGRLDLDEDVRVYVKSFPEKAYVLTTRQLLSHQAGVRHYQFSWRPPLFSEMGLNRQFDNVGSSLALFADDPLEFQPDTAFQYSTYGYTLASAAIEGASGKSFLEAIESSVFAPAGMGETQANYRDRAVAHRVSEYIAVSGSLVVPAPETNSSNKWAGGGFLSTPSDLVRFANALMADEIIGPESREMMFTPRHLLDGSVNRQHYGLGWRVGEFQLDPGEGRKVRFVHHGGTTVGAQSVLFMIPEERLAVAICTNSNIRGSGPLLQAAADISRIFLSR